jgi:hypothetical protein
MTMTATKTTLLRELEALTSNFDSTYVGGESYIPNAQEISNALQKVRVLLINAAR